MVDLKNSFLHGEAFHARFEFLIKCQSREVEILIVHSHRNHEMQELSVRNLFPPGEFLTGGERSVYILSVDVIRLVGTVRKRQCGI